jgi:hypothetical protein
MPKETFNYYPLQLESKRRSACRYSCVSVEEQIAMFLAVVTRNENNHAIQERFRQSGETVHSYFYVVHQALVCLYEEVLLLPSSCCPRGNQVVRPYFKDCSGALDGSHVRARVPESDTSRFRNRKGFLRRPIKGRSG